MAHFWQEVSKFCYQLFDLRYQHWTCANTRSCFGTFWASLLLSKGLFQRCQLSNWNKNRTPIPQTAAARALLTATNHNVETIYPFWIWMMSGGSGKEWHAASQSLSLPCPWCFQPLILTADANSLKKRPYQTFAFKQIDKGHFEKLPPHDCSVRWHVPCVPALLTT